MSKHVKALRHCSIYTDEDEAVVINAAADHMESLERQLRIARKYLRLGVDLQDWYASAACADGLAKMRKAAKKGKK